MHVCTTKNVDTPLHWHVPARLRWPISTCTPSGADAAQEHAHVLGAHGLRCHPLHEVGQHDDGYCAEVVRARLGTCTRERKGASCTGYIIWSRARACTLDTCFLILRSRPKILSTACTSSVSRRFCSTGRKSRSGVRKDSMSERGRQRPVCSVSHSVCVSVRPRGSRL